MANQRRDPIALDVAVRRGRKVIERLRVSADPNFPDDLRETLVDSMWRNGRHHERYICDYVLDVWRVGKDRNPSKPFATLAYQAKK